MKNNQLITDLKNIGVKSGDTLNLKVSMRSMGNFRAEDFISSCLEVVGERGTLVVESFINSYHISTLKRQRRWYHIASYTHLISTRYSLSYAGALANAMITYPKAVRSTHPIQKFTAIGFRAMDLTLDHTPDSYAYDVLKVMAETGGKNLSIGSNVVGVGTTHVAIGMLGLKQVIPKTGIYYYDGEVKLFMRDWVGGCAEGFGNFMHHGNRGKIGNADSLLTDMRETLDIELSILKVDPTYFMCGKCIDCRYSWEFSTGRFKKILLPLFRTYNRLK